MKRTPVAPDQPAPYPRLDPSYPVKPWVEPKTATTFAPVTVRQENGSFVAVIAEATTIRAVRKTQGEAEAAVKKSYIELLTTRVNSDEDAGLEVRPEIMNMLKRRLRSRKLTIEQARAKYGRR